MNLFYILPFLFSVLFYAEPSLARTVRYELTATQGSVNLSGKKSVDFALMLNGGIPAPTLEFTEGDDAEILVKNNIPNQELSIHWHGILLPPEMDGVPYVTTPTIPSGGSLLFKYKLRQNGTYWYHSHTNVQEQKGVYGAMVIHPKKKTLDYDRDLVAILSDWSDENATQILKNLRKDGDYYLYKKKTMRSWWGAIQAGALGNFLNNEWTRMGGMDYSDVGYDAFLINGKINSQLLDAHPGEKIRIRLINAAASSYFYVSLGNIPMQVISADGTDIKPINAKEILIGMAETYDVLFTIPEHKNYELKITAQDGTGMASGFIGMGEKVLAPIKPFPDMYASMNHMGMSHDMKGMTHDMSGMDHSAHEAIKNDPSATMNHDAEKKPEHSGHDMAGMTHEMSTANTMSMNHSGHKMDMSSHSMGSTSTPVISTPIIETLTVDELKSPVKTNFSEKSKFHDVKLELDGDMRRYIWFINGKAIHQERNIIINENDVVRFTFVNKTMMHHPMHLHGHFFRVLNKHGEYSPLKHTVDVAPHMTKVIEFKANEPGEWMLHCHNLYHLKTGMARVMKYSTYTPTPEMKHMQMHDPHHHDHWYTYGMVEAASNHAEANYRLSQTWNEFEARVETRNSENKNFSFQEPWEIESDLFYHRWINKYLSIVGGGALFNKSTRAVAGASYILPWLIRSEVLLDHKGKPRFDIEKRFQWTKTIFTDADFTWRPTQKSDISRPFEYEISLMYAPAWSWSAGLMLTERNLGAGVHFQF